MDDEDEDEVAPIYSDGEDSEEDGDQPQLDPVTGLMAGQQVNQPPIVPQPSAGLTQTLPIIQQVGALVSSQKMERLKSSNAHFSRSFIEFNFPTFPNLQKTFKIGRNQNWQLQYLATY